MAGPVEQAVGKVVGKRAGHIAGKATELMPHAAVGYGALKAKEKLVDRGPLYRPYHQAKYLAQRHVLPHAQGYYGGGFAR